MFCFDTLCVIWYNLIIILMFNSQVHQLQNYFYTYNIFIYILIQMNLDMSMKFESHG